jgi:hypothetical protein
MALVPSVDKHGNPFLQLLLVGSDRLKGLFATLDPSAPGLWTMHPEFHHKMIAAASGADTQEYVQRECAIWVDAMIVVCPTGSRRWLSTSNSSVQVLSRTAS